MDRKCGHPADHGALLTLRLNNGRVDVSLFEGLDGLLLAVPIQPLVQPIPSESLVVPVKVNPFQDQAQPWSFGNVHLILPPAALDHFLLGVALCHRNHQADHLPDLVQHKALAPYGDHRKLYIAVHERLSTRHLCDIAAGTGVTWSLLRSEVVEVMGAFVERKQTVHLLKGLWLEAEGCYSASVIVF